MDNEDIYGEVGRTVSFAMGKKGRATGNFDDTIDFKHNSGGWNTSSDSAGSRSKTDSNSRSGSGSGTSGSGLGSNGSGSAGSGSGSSPELSQKSAR